MHCASVILILKPHPVIRKALCIWIGQRNGRAMMTRAHLDTHALVKGFMPLSFPQKVLQ